MAIRKSKNNSLPSANKDEKLFAALDVGGSKLRLACGYVSSDKDVTILGFLEGPSAGIVNGSISDLNALAQCIGSLIQNFQNSFHITISDIVVGVPGCYINAQNQHGTATIQTGTVTLADRNAAINSAKAGVNVKIDEDFTTIHLIPQNYRTESSNLVENPIGMFAKRLDVNVHIIGCNTLYMKNIENALKMASRDIYMKTPIYEGLAASNAVLFDSEIEIGVIHIDIGSGCVSVTVFEGKRQLLSFGISDGGDYITRFIAKAFGISPADAEYLKCNYGKASYKLLQPEEYDEVLPIPSEKGASGNQITKVALCSYINRALVNMVDLIIQKVVAYCGESFDKLTIGSGVVLTGGTAKLQGIEYVFSERLRSRAEDPTCRFLNISSKVRIGHPIKLSMYENAGDRVAVSDTDKAVLIDLLRSARFEELNQDDNRAPKEKVAKGIVGRIIQRAKVWADREL